MSTGETSRCLEEEPLAEDRAVVELRDQSQRDRITALLAELESEFGPVDPKLDEKVRRAWPTPADALKKRRSI